MSRLIKVPCGCEFHQLIIEIDTVHGEEMAFLSIVEHKSQNTGKLLKKPKLIGDVVLYSKQLNFLRTFLKND